MDTIEYWKRQWNSVAENKTVTENLKATISIPKLRYAKGWYENEHGAIIWIDDFTDDVKNLLECQVKYWGENFVLFRGSRNEKLGSSQNIFDKDSVVASVIVYDYTGNIRVYRGFSMSSSFKEFGAIADGIYTVVYGKKKTGHLSSRWRINDGNAVDCLDGINYAFVNNYKNTEPYSETQKNGIYIHSTNKNGYAGFVYNKETRDIIGGVSTGCLLISSSCPDKGYIGWDEFNEQLKGVKSFTLKLIRE